MVGMTADEMARALTDMMRIMNGRKPVKWTCEKCNGENMVQI